MHGFKSNQDLILLKGNTNSTRHIDTIQSIYKNRNNEYMQACMKQK